MERKMLAETLQRLRLVRPLSQYSYVGFGSTYFADFILMHRALGIRRLVSIERDGDKRERFLFNRPFRTVRIVFGESNSVLPTLRWVNPAIVWLDYDGQLDESVLADIDWVASSAAPGSVLIVSVNAHPVALDLVNRQNRYDELVRNVGIENVPNGVTKSGHLGGWKLAGVTRTIVDGAIRAALASRRIGDSRLDYRQLFNFRYQDGARMTTVGGIVTRRDQRDVIERCGFDELAFVCDGDDAYEIVVPRLTNREIRWLDRHLPATPAGVNVGMIPEKDLRAYADGYRFFPAFVDSEF